MIEQRQSKYGEAYLVTGYILEFLDKWLSAHKPEKSTIIKSLGWRAYAWIAILNKLIRALWTPEDPDHWEDIKGYAELVLRHK